MKKLLLLFPLFFVVLAFQNCAKVGDATLVASFQDPNAEFFNYPYMEKPDFFSHSQLMRLEKTEGLRKWRFFGAISSAEAQVPVSYTLELRSQTGQILCPTQSQTLTSGSGNVDYECDSPHDPLTTRLTLTVQVGERTKVIVRDQTYPADTE